MPGAGSITIGTVQKINLKDSDVNEVYAIQCFNQSNPNQQIKAYPFDMSMRRIPLIGESVILLLGTSGESKPTKRNSNTTYYYLNPVSVQRNPHNNALPTSKTLIGGIAAAGAYAAAAAGVPGISGGGSSSKLGKGFSERSDVGSLQPFIGDVLMEGRFGHSMRFGYTPKGSDTSKTPSWSSSTDNDPITIISNGRKSGGSYNKFIIEDVNKDLSSIWMGSSQKIKLTPAQTGLGGADAPGQYSKPSILMNSDRIFLNARNENVIITAKKDIINATPGWQMEMDKLFTLIEKLASELTDLTSAKATYATGVGPTGPATNASKVSTILSDIKKMKQ
tara:strand:+ start:226 stop:1230 length:1005 start_codon:yes stop_codon:yes gene_type:complete